MIYRFVLVSNEVNNFHRDITIDSDATFFQLHETILNSVNYTKDHLLPFSFVMTIGLEKRKLP